MAAMEGSDYLYGAFCRGENGPSTPEKKAGYGAEHFAVDDLLDFSNEEGDESGGLVGFGDDGSARNSTDDSSGGEVTATGNSTDSSGGDAAAVDSRSRSVFHFDPHLSGGLMCRSFTDVDFSSADLCEPQIGGLTDLEWLSNFVDDSLPSENFQKIHQSSGGVSSTAFSEITASDDAALTARTEVTSRDTDGSASSMAPQPPEAVVPAKVRSKRSRAHGGWPSKLIELPTSMTATSSPDSELIGSRVGPAAVGGGKKTPKPKKKDPSAGAALAPAPDGRKCFHCQTDKTPQWRTGPMGPKTLCNACGVRFKSGRLVPEYRPAASPTFVASEHSNSHRKVLELRRQKEMLQQHHLFHSGGGGGGGGAASLYDGPSPVSAVAGEQYLIPDHDYRRLSY